MIRLLLLLLFLTSCATPPVTREIRQTSGNSRVAGWLVRQMEKEVAEMEERGLSRETIKEVWYQRGYAYLMFIFRLPEQEREWLIKTLRDYPETDIRIIPACQCDHNDEQKDLHIRKWSSYQEEPAYDLRGYTPFSRRGSGH